MQPSSWMTPEKSNSMGNNSNFWSNGGFRKRKAAASDLDERVNPKMFVTEEKMVKEMQTLSLDLAQLNNNIPISTPLIDKEPAVNTIQSVSTAEENDSDDENESNSQASCLEFHKLLKDSFKNDDLQDTLISKLCESERRKLTMQIVPYMPIHPAQLNNDNLTSEEEEEKTENEVSSSVISDELTNAHLFKTPKLPTPYTVEEPCDNTTKRPSTMKRSYSQSNQYNSNLSVTELKHDGNDNASIHQSQSAYFIVEPTSTGICQSSSNTSNSSLSSGGPSVRITEFIENPTSNNEFTSTLDDDDIDMQSVASSDTGDKMDDD